MSTIGYNDIPYSYRDKIKCAHCNNLNMGDKKTDYYGKDMYFCKENRTYIKLDSHICSSIKADSKIINSYGSYNPSGCYITTIVCDILGYPDDCELLNTLRDFRDNYMKKNNYQIPLLQQYDELGPHISKGIYNDPNRDIVALDLLKYNLIPCAEEIKNKNYDAAISIYTNMVDELNDIYNLNSIEVDYDKPYDIETLGKARVLEN